MAVTPPLVLSGNGNPRPEEGPSIAGIRRRGDLSLRVSSGEAWFLSLGMWMTPFAEATPLRMAEFWAVLERAQDTRYY